MTFHHLLDQLNADEHASCIIKALEPEHRLNPKLNSTMVLFDYMISVLTRTDLDGVWPG
jgi:hypothetical protein